MASGGGSGASAFKVMAAGAIAIVALLAVTLTGIAVATQYKLTNLVDNTTADNFVTGMAIFGSFSAVIVISIVGKIIVGMYKGGAM